jgi:anti-sigma B factor antagonist
MEPHTIFHEIIDSIPVIYIEGDMTSEEDEAVMSLYEELKGDSPLLRLFFNFNKTNYINSAGIATLINIIQDMNDQRGKVSFIGLSNHFLKVMDIVGISDFVDIYDTNEKALSGKPDF